MDLTGVAGVKGDNTRIGYNAGDSAQDTAHTSDVVDIAIKQGACPFCGNQEQRLGKLKPLNIRSRVQNGKCTHPHCPENRALLHGQQVPTGNESTPKQQEPPALQTVQPIATPPIHSTMELSENDSINTILTAMRDNRQTASV